MDIVWNDRFQDEEEKRQAEYVMRHAPKVYDMAHEHYLTGQEQANRYFVMGYTEKGEEPPKLMSITYTVEDGHAKPLTVGDAKEEHKRRMEQQKELLKDNPLREIAQKKKDEPERREPGQTLSAEPEKEWQQELKKLKERREKEREKDRER